MNTTECQNVLGKIQKLRFGALFVAIFNWVIALAIYAAIILLMTFASEEGSDAIDAEGMLLIQQFNTAHRTCLVKPPCSSLWGNFRFGDTPNPGREASLHSLIFSPGLVAVLIRKYTVVT